MSDLAQPEKKQPFIAFSHAGYAFFWWGKLFASFSAEILNVAVGWQVYELTRNPLDLGLVGLVQFLPSLVLVLATGNAADRFNRKGIVLACFAVEIICAAALLALTLGANRSVLPIFGALLLLGVARAFLGPSAQALAPNLVPKEHLANAVALNSSSWQIASIAGPLAGGLLLTFGTEVAYGAALALFLSAAVLIILMRNPPQQFSEGKRDLKELLAGFTFIYRSKMVFGAISLDLVAVLLSGAPALLPIFASDILQAGPVGLGLLRAAPGIGAIAMALYLAFYPIERRAGAIMFLAVALFGVVTVLFGISKTVWVSVAALAIMGAADMLSVYVREILVQLATPDDVRGRVNAVNMVFVGASNELGAFRAGVMAHYVGAVAAVVIGGIGAVATAGLWALWFPQLRKAERLDGT